MLMQQTLDKLHSIRQHGMANWLDTQRSNTSFQELSHEEFVSLMVDAEIEDREKRRLTRLLKGAKLKYDAWPENIDYRANRQLDRQVVTNLLTCDWIEKSLNTIITGSTGSGKTWLACALAQQAARKGYSVLYKRLSRLLEELEIAYGDGSLHKLRTRLAKVQLLILDDWALAPLSARGRHELLELIDDRVRQGSILITSQLPIDKWHDYIGEPTVADAILDRIVHNSHKIELKGESMRKTHSLLEETKHV